MIRQINHTGRKRIARNAVRISLRDEDGRLAFDATLKLGEYALPSDAHVWVEAYRQASWMQFSWGRVSQPAPPTVRWLDDFDSGDGILFRVRVTSASDSHRILAEADRVPCEALDGKNQGQSLLPIRVGDLGHEVWRLEMDGDTPTLVVNRSVGDGKALARTPEFVALVYPAVVRAIFTRVLLDEDYLPEEEEEGWRGQWARFARQFLGVDEIPDSRENRRLWIEDTACAYAQKYALAERYNETRKNVEDIG